MLLRRKNSKRSANLKATPNKQKNFQKKTPKSLKGVTKLPIVVIDDLQNSKTDKNSVKKLNSLVKIRLSTVLKKQKSNSSSCLEDLQISSLTSNKNRKKNSSDSQTSSLKENDSPATKKRGKSTAERNDKKEKKLEISSSEKTSASLRRSSLRLQPVNDTESSAKAKPRSEEKADAAKNSNLSKVTVDDLKTGQENLVSKHGTRSSVGGKQRQLLPLHHNVDDLTSNVTTVNKDKKTVQESDSEKVLKKDSSQVKERTSQSKERQIDLAASKKPELNLSRRSSLKRLSNKVMETSTKANSSSEKKDSNTKNSNLYKLSVDESEAAERDVQLSKCSTRSSLTRNSNIDDLTSNIATSNKGRLKDAQEMSSDNIGEKFSPQQVKGKPSPNKGRQSKLIPSKETIVNSRQSSLRRQSDKVAEASMKTKSSLANNDKSGTNSTILNKTDIGDLDASIKDIQISRRSSRFSVTEKQSRLSLSQCQDDLISAEAMPNNIDEENMQDVVSEKTSKEASPQFKEQKDLQTKRIGGGKRKQREFTPLKVHDESKSTKKIKKVEELSNETNTSRVSLRSVERSNNSILSREKSDFNETAMSHLDEESEKLNTSLQSNTSLRRRSGLLENSRSSSSGKRSSELSKKGKISAPKKNNSESSLVDSEPYCEDISETNRRLSKRNSNKVQTLATENKNGDKISKSKTLRKQTPKNANSNISKKNTNRISKTINGCESIMSPASKLITKTATQIVEKPKKKRGRSVPVAKSKKPATKIIAKKIDQNVPIDDLTILSCSTSNLHDDSLLTSTPAPYKKKKKSVERISDVMSSGKKPKRGTLKQKRWIINTLKERNEGYEDDLFESNKFENYKELIQMDDDDDSDTSVLSIDTPKCAFRVTPNPTSKTPRYKDCYSPMEWLKNRKLAEEIMYRRNQKRKSGSSTKATPSAAAPEPASELSESMLEQKRLEFEKFVEDVTKKPIQTVGEDESDKDEYFSDA